MSSFNLKPGDDGTILLWGIPHRVVQGRWHPVPGKERALKAILHAVYDRILAQEAERNQLQRSRG